MKKIFFSKNIPALEVAQGIYVIENKVGVLNGPDFIEILGEASESPQYKKITLMGVEETPTGLRFEKIRDGW